MVMYIIASSEGKNGREPGRRHPGALICEFKLQRDRRGNESSECANK